jgi:hypothetical protein
MTMEIYFWPLLKYLTYKFAQINSLWWRSSQERFLVGLPYFSHRVWTPFKIHRRFKFEYVPKFLSWILLGIWCQAYWESCSKYWGLASCKVCILLEHEKASILNFKVQKNLKFIWKSIKWAGPTGQWTCTFGLHPPPQPQPCQCYCDHVAACLPCATDSDRWTALANCLALNLILHVEAKQEQCHTHLFELYVSN